jgi:hypothetical protein
LNEGNLRTSNVTFEDNQGSIGGAVFNAGRFIATMTEFVGSTGGRSGAVHSTGIFRLTDGSFRGNVAYSRPGYHALEVAAGNAILERVSFSGNSRYALVGVAGRLELIAASFHGNDLLRGVGPYGAIVEVFDRGDALISRSTFSGNFGFEGIVACNVRGTGTSLEIRDSTFADNWSYAYDPSTINNPGCGFVTNTYVEAPSGSERGMVGVACREPIGADNVASDRSCGTRLVVEDALLRPLALNGGTTLSRLPRSGSPLVDRGTACEAIDQRGRRRPQGLACDVGAVER